VGAYPAAAIRGVNVWEMWLPERTANRDHEQQEDDGMNINKGSQPLRVTLRHSYP